METALNVQILRQGIRRIDRAACLLHVKRIGLVLAFAAGAFVPVAAGQPQQSGAQVPTKPLVIPNRTMDSQELNELAEKSAKTKNFAAANEARKHAIEEETNKLLILAKDLKAKTDNLGSGPLSPTLLREAEVIEILANDVKQKMKLTVNSD